MVKPLSEQLADLSIRAKQAEDALSAAQKEAHDKIEVRKQQASACRGCDGRRKGQSGNNVGRQ